MYTKPALVKRIPQAIGVIMLALVMLNGCSSQPTLIQTNLPSTIQVPPSPTIIPPTSTSEPPVPVKSLDEIVGTWQTHCGGGPCLVKITADGTYRMDYANPTEGQGVTFIDGGTITFADGIFHLVSTHGYCEAMPNGYFQALMTFLDGKPSILEFTLTQPDECSDRSRALLYPMHYVEQ